MSRKLPLIVILGSTATGKTKLSIELAKRFHGEIISADSMQIYKGLDISTAKATKEEQLEAVHHLLDIRNACSRQEPFHVVQFRDAALPIIDRLFLEEKLPIIVGGTNYYIESLLWKVLVEPSATDKEPQRKTIEKTESVENVDTKVLNSESQTMSAEDRLQRMTPNDLEGKDRQYLHELLAEVDPLSAQRLHPNDERKVRRALEVFMKLGKRISDVHANQRAQEGSSNLGGPLRFEHIIMFWIQTDQAVLEARIDSRIDGMIAQGLLQEVRQFYNDILTTLENEPLDCTKGIMQAIGLKEFIPYLEKYPETLDAEITEFIKSGESCEWTSGVPDGLKILKQCLEMLRLHTKQYSRKQIKWIENRFISTRGRLAPPVYVLNSTEASTRWSEDVFLPAEDVVECYIHNKTPKLQPAERKLNARASLNENVTHFCAECDRRFIGDSQWAVHLKSKKHKNRLWELKWIEKYKEREEKKQQELIKSQGIFYHFFDIFRQMRSFLAKLWPF